MTHEVTYFLHQETGFRSRHGPEVPIVVFTPNHAQSFETCRGLKPAEV